MSWLGGGVGTGVGGGGGIGVGVASGVGVGVGLGVGLGVGVGLGPASAEEAAMSAVAIRSGNALQRDDLELMSSGGVFILSLHGIWVILGQPVFLLSSYLRAGSG